VFPIGDQNEPGGRRAPITLLIIAINVLVFLLLQLPEADKARQPFTYGFSTIPYEITHDTDLVRPVPATIDGQQVVIDEAP
jgi:membrane associated rhomboid family serine protease